MQNTNKNSTKPSAFRFLTAVGFARLGISGALFQVLSKRNIAPYWQCQCLCKSLQAVVCILQKLLTFTLLLHEKHHHTSPVYGQVSAPSSSQRWPVINTWFCLTGVVNSGDFEKIRFVSEGEKNPNISKSIINWQKGCLWPEQEV